MTARLVFTTLALGFLLGCQSDQIVDPPLGGEGQTRIYLTDAPFPYGDVASVEIHIVRVAVSTTADTGTSADDQEWITVAEPRARYDLLQLRDGATALLGEFPLSAGQYKALRLVLDADSSRVVRTTGDEAIVSWQGSGEMSLNAVVEGALDVPEGGGRIVIDFDVGRSFAVRTGPAFELLFFPYLRAVNEATTGAITGTVYGLESDFGVPVGGGVVSVFRGDTASPPETWSLAATAPVDSAGRYAVHFLQARSYVLQATPPAGTGWTPGTVGPVVVTAGTTVTADIMLGGNSGGTGDGYLRIVGDTSLAVGEEAPFFAAIFDANGDSVITSAVTWTSSDTTVAMITPTTGQSVLVRGVGEGLALVSAVNGSRAAAVQVSVGDSVPPPSNPVASVELSPASQTVMVGDSAWVQAILRDSAGVVLSNRVVTWTVSKQNVLRLDGQFGHYLLFTALAPDTVIVTGTSEGKSGTAVVMVK